MQKSKLLLQFIRGHLGHNRKFLLQFLRNITFSNLIFSKNIKILWLNGNLHDFQIAFIIQLLPYM